MVTSLLSSTPLSRPSLRCSIVPSRSFFRSPICQSLLSTLSFAHFLLQDESFSGWSSVYHFCTGPTALNKRTLDAAGTAILPSSSPLSLSGLAYCTDTYRWNLNGWRKALSIWNFVLSSALGLQHLFIELGLGGLLPGEDAIPRECFVSIIWRLVPFFLNKWESDFGAECSSILFELPHFAVELLIILPCVQLMAARLGVLSRPPVNNGRHVVPGVAPDVMRARWTSDWGQRRFLDRLRRNLRPLALVCGLTFLAITNAIVMPLYLEHIAIASTQSVEYMRYQDALASLHTGQAQWGGKTNKKSRTRRKTDVHGEYLSEELIGIMADTTLYMCAASVVREGVTSFDNVRDSGCVSDSQQEMVSWMLERDIIVSVRDTGEGDPGDTLALNATLLTAHPRWALDALEFETGGNKNTNEDMDEESIKDQTMSTNDNEISDHRTELLQHVLFGEFFYGSEVDTPMSFVAMQREFVDRAVKRWKGAGRNATEGHQETSSSFWTPLAPLIALFKRSPPTDASRFLLLLEKHTIELGRMSSTDHRSLVPLIELALAIMRLSCEKWFSLVAVYVSYIVFRDPPAHVREYIKIVAVASRVFQHCILMSFPAVCWAYGAGFLFSTFASAVFWTTPIVRLVEHVKKVAMEVQPMHWHPVTHDEVERMGGNCAICWGTIIATGEEEMNRGMDTDRERDPGEDEVMGLSCGHAYHQSCLLEWLHSCFGQSRKATCPMCQSLVPLKITYKLRAMLTFGAGTEGVDGGGAGGERAQRVGIPPAQRAYPGLATLVQAMPEEFVGRWGFDLAFHGGAEDIVVVGQEGDQDGGAGAGWMMGSDDEDDEDDPDYMEGDSDDSEFSLRRAESADALIISADDESATSGSSIRIWRVQSVGSMDSDGKSEESEDGDSQESEGEVSVPAPAHMTLRPRRR